ncbi:hypothetical protein [uncultured Tateyamaria sp.]|uniref:calcium-binding protein n=1 Tax=Tateyamaria sp. 1078 TaxID=3417464 RepID=UPI00262C1A31|nr:hypothetical protein [uncultured Tateyamaria sp.]
MLGLMLVGLLGVALVVNLVDDDDDTKTVTSENETDTGTEGNDIIQATSGNDTIFARAGDDIVLGGDGSDSAFGSSGEDILVGEAGNDFLRGGRDDDLLFGSEGEDTLLGDGGDDLLDGTDIVDAAGLIDAALAAELSGQTLTDAQIAAFVDINAETGGADDLSGGAGNDEIFAGNNDVVDTGTGSDTLYLGDWIDGLTDEADPAQPPLPLIDGFTPSEDAIVYFYEGALPTAVGFSEEDNGGNLIIDGEVVARFINTDFASLSTETIQFVQI